MLKEVGSKSWTLSYIANASVTYLITPQAHFPALDYKFDILSKTSLAEILPQTSKFRSLFSFTGG